MLRKSLTAPLMAAAGLAALLVLGACSENRPFERESAGAQTRLAVPSSLTPPISVRGIDGAPAEWKLAERVAEALRSRDIPASAATRSRSAFVLKGEMRPGAERNGRSRVEVVWSLYDGVGKKVGEVTQMAAVPGAAFKAPNEGVVEAMADAAAESIAPLVPSSSLQLADGTETGERKGNERAKMEERDRVTAVGKMPATTGVSKNLLAPPKRAAKVETEAQPAKPAARTATAPEATPPKAATPKVATPKPAAPKASATAPATPAPAARYSATPPAPAATPPSDKKALTAVGRYQGESALSRNLFRPDIDPAKPLPKPQRAAPETPSQPAMREGPEAEESLSLSAAPEPASDTRRTPARATRPQHAEAPTPRADVAERPRQIAESPAPRRETRPEPGQQPEQYAERATRGSYQFWIQVGSHKDEAIARAEWQKLQGAAQAVVANAGNRIQRADLGARGVYYRIQIGPFASQGEAGQFCAQLKARAVDCFLAPPEPATASVRPPAEAPTKAAPAAPQPKPVAKPAEPKPMAKPAEAKPVAKPADPKAVAKPAETKPLAKPAEAKPAPAEKPREAAAAPKKPEAEAPALPDQKSEPRPPRNSSAEKPDAPLSTAPGLPGVLD
jgi:hypothetical protein